jgi:hypothetical protein
MSDPRVAIQDLTKAGFTEARIAHELTEELRKSEDLKEDQRISQSTIHRIKNEQQSVRFDVGQGLIRVRERLLATASTPAETSDCRAG